MGNFKMVDKINIRIRLHNVSGKYIYVVEFTSQGNFFFAKLLKYCNEVQNVSMNAGSNSLNNLTLSANTPFRLLANLRSHTLHNIVSLLNELDFALKNNLEFRILKQSGNQLNQEAIQNNKSVYAPKSQRSDFILNLSENRNFEDTPSENNSDEDSINGLEKTNEKFTVRLFFLTKKEAEDLGILVRNKMIRDQGDGILQPPTVYS